MNNQSKSNIVIYNNGELELDVSIENDTIWLTQKQLGELFGVTKQNISLHINRIFKDNELHEDAVVKFSLTTAKDGKSYNTKHYNLDMIISIGYRVNSVTATKFRQWATLVLKNYVQNGYAINTHKLTEHRLNKIENDITSIKAHIQNNSLEIKQGIYFDGEIFDAYVFVSSLIKEAKEKIVLIDNYIDESVLALFSKNITVELFIYTANINKQLKLDIQKYNTQYKNLQIQKINNFHDRFLIIDDMVYHFGASLKDLAKKSFAFSQLSGIKSEDILSKVKGK